MASCVSLSDESFALRLSSLKAMAKGFHATASLHYRCGCSLSREQMGRWGQRSGTMGRGGGSSVNGQLCSCTTCGTDSLATRRVDGDAGVGVIAGVGVDGRGRAASRGRRGGGGLARRTWLLACDGSARPHRCKHSPHSSQCDGDLAAPPDPDSRPPTRPSIPSHLHISTPAMADRFPSLDEFDAGTLRRCSPDAPPDTLLTHPRPERGPR
jgi:hypothetical protein